MEILKKKPVAMLIMSLVMLASMVVMAKISMGTALIIVLVLLAVFLVIDWITCAKFLTQRQSRFAGIAVSAAAIVGIGLWVPLGGTADFNIIAESVADPSGDVTENAVETGAEKADETYELGVFYYVRGKYEQAIQALQEVTDNSGNYIEAQKLLAEAKDGYRLALNDAAKIYVEKEDYELAISILETGLAVLPQDMELLHTIDEYTSAYTLAARTKAIKSAETFAAEEDYANALLSIQNVISTGDNDAELTALSNKYATDYRDDILTQATMLLHSEGYETAVQLLQSAMTVLPNDSEIANAIVEYEEYAPVYLIEDIDYLQIDDFWGLVIDNDELIDSDGNSILGHYYFYHDHGNTSGNITFDLAGSYHSFWGTLVLPYGYRHTSSNIYIYVYGDDKLLYKSPNMTAGFHTENFSVDVTDISVLMIEFENKIGDGQMDLAKGYLTNAYLSKLEINE